MDTEDLIERHPQLFHMAAAGSWPAIQRHGLLTTEDIVRTAGLAAEAQEALLLQRRASSTLVEHPLLGRVAIRDQGPLNLTHLRGSLTDVTVEEWLAILNSRVFFWLHPDKLAALLNARRYRGEPQDVITVDTRGLLNDFGHLVRLSPMNSGATLYPNTPARGSETFSTIADYDYAERRRRRGPQNAIVELAVSGGVPNISDYVIEVRRIQGDTVLDYLYP